MATNKTTKETKTKAVKDQRPQEVDPPIIVGGDGSTYVWVRTDLALTYEPNPQPDYPVNAASYRCYKVEVDLVSVSSHDGVAQQNPHPIKHPRRHRTRFF